MSLEPQVKVFFDTASHTFSYVVSDSSSGHCAIIDSVLDYDAASARTNTDSADAIKQYIIDQRLETQWILETHAHADHLSAAPYLKAALGGAIGIGEHITEVQLAFRNIYNLENAFLSDGSQFDRLFADNQCFKLGDLEIRVMSTPGHTPACVTYIVGHCAFVGDTLFMPDYGTARVDFPGGDARTLYQSIQRIFTLPEDTKLYMCHDYLPSSRSEYAWESTVAEEKASNVHANESVTEQEFIAMRTARDATLSMPALLLPSVQVNIRAGSLPPEEDNGVRYLKLPLNQL